MVFSGNGIQIRGLSNSGKHRGEIMGYHSCHSTTTMPLIRPKLLIDTARIGARMYDRERDLAAAISGLNLGLAFGAQPRIVARLSEAERDYEVLRRARSPAYRSGKHVQILSALIAEADRAAGNRPALSRSHSSDQTNASGSDALRLAM
jgi:hypothetical protein